MAKLGFFWYSKICIFACTVRKDWPCFDWYLEASKTGNDRVTSSQETNKKLLETVSELKKLLALTARSQVLWKWEVTFGIYAIWLLISGHLCLLFHSECDFWLVKFWFGLVALVWVHRHLVQTTWVNMGIAHSKVPHSTWEPLGGKKKFFFFD